MNSLPVFVRSVCRNPIQVGSVIPSSSTLSRAIASLVPRDSTHILEIGAGTGALTRALLERGVPPERLWAVEIDRCLADHLRHQFPRVNVLCGDARRLSELLPPRMRVHSIVSGLPLRNMRLRDRRKIATAALALLESDGQLLQFTYGLCCPIETRGLAITAQRLARIWNNFPPAAIWRYQHSA